MDRLFNSSCGCFVKQMTCKTFYTFCYDASGLYLADSFSWDSRVSGVFFKHCLLCLNAKYSKWLCLIFFACIANTFQWVPLHPEKCKACKMQPRICHLGFTIEVNRNLLIYVCCGFQMQENKSFLTNCYPANG